MRNFTLILGFILMIISLSAQAEYRIYTNQQDFENDKWSICEAATDGCNNYFMTDWKVAGGTRKMCAPDFVPEWNCTKYKENSISTMSLPVTTSMPITTTDAAICTREYMPVCWVDNVTYSNKCMAEKWPNVDIAYEWKCINKKALSENDQNFYNVLNERLSKNSVILVNKVLNNYLGLISGYSKKEELNTKLIQLLDEKIFSLISVYPQDKELPEKVYNKYMKYSLFKLELMKLDF